MLCLLTLCVLVSLSNDPALCTVSELVARTLISLHRDFRTLFGPTFPVKGLIVKLVLHIRYNQLRERSVDYVHIDSVIISLA